MVEEFWTTSNEPGKMIKMNYSRQRNGKGKGFLLWNRKWQQQVFSGEMRETSDRSSCSRLTLSKQNARTGTVINPDGLKECVPLSG